MSRYKILALLFLSLLLFGCKKDKKPKATTPSIDFQISEAKAIELGDLKVYPIFSKTKQKDTHLIFAEATKLRGFITRKKIEGRNTYSRWWESLYFANKTNQDAAILFGDIAKKNNYFFIFQEGVELPAKKITPVNCTQLDAEYYSEHKTSPISPLFPCPPVPLRNLLHQRNYLVDSWLQQALPLLGFGRPTKLDVSEMDLTLYRNQYDDDDNDTERIPQENIGDLDIFNEHFAPIGENNAATGCLVTYRDTILISYFFAEANLFQKEWPFISTSIYLNQLVGYKPKEMSTYTPFIDIQTSRDRIQQLWHQELVLPKDNAYRGNFGDVPFYLVWF